jgi:hypothetical protein
LNYLKAYFGFDEEAKNDWLYYYCVYFRNKKC